MAGGVAPVLDTLANNPAPEVEYRSQIDNVEVSGNIDRASLREQTGMGLEFVNCFYLLEIDEQWAIVSKPFESS